jgi:hypothetical protein
MPASDCRLHGPFPILELLVDDCAGAFPDMDVKLFRRWLAAFNPYMTKLRSEFEDIICLEAVRNSDGTPWDPAVPMPKTQVESVWSAGNDEFPIAMYVCMNGERVAVRGADEKGEPTWIAIDDRVGGIETIIEAQGNSPAFPS